METKPGEFSYPAIIPWEDPAKVTSTGREGMGNGRVCCLLLEGGRDEVAWDGYIVEILSLK